MNKIIVLSLVTALVSWSALAVDAPTRIIVNGVVLTMDKNDRRAEAVAIDGDRIVAVGANTEIRKLAGGNVTTLCRMAHNPLSQHSILLSNFPAVLTLCSGTFGEGDDAARPRSDLSHSGPYVGGVDGCESGLPLECRSDRLPAEKDR
jgi:hypothetical protein